MSNILLKGNSKDFDVDKINFEENIIKLSNGSKFVNLNYNRKKLTFETPYMSLPFGINSNSQYGDISYNMDIAFDDMSNKEIKGFYNNIVKIDKKILEQGTVNSNNWFKLENADKKVIKELYNKTIKKSKNKKGEVIEGYPPRMRIKLPYDLENEKFNFEIKNSKGEDYTEDIRNTLKRNSKVKCIIQCTRLWISNKSFSCQWKLKRMDCIPFIEKPIDFLDDSD